MFCVIWDFLEYFKFVKESRARTKSHPAVGSWAWPPIGKEPETSPTESALRIAQMCKEPSAAQARGPRGQDKTRRGEPRFGVLQPGVGLNPLYLPRA